MLLGRELVFKGLKNPLVLKNKKCLFVNFKSHSSVPIKFFLGNIKLNVECEKISALKINVELKCLSVGYICLLDKRAATAHKIVATPPNGGNIA